MLDRLDQLLADLQQRIEAHQRILEHRADLLAAHAPHLARRQAVDAAPAQPDLAGGDAPRRVEQAEDRHAGQRLAGARFADEAEDLARRDRERDVVQREQDAAARRDFHAQALDPEQRFGGHLSLGLNTSRSQSPSRLTASTSTTSRTPGNTVTHHSPENRHLVADADQRAERGRGRRHADAEEATASPRSGWRAPATAWRSPAPDPARWAGRAETGCAAADSRSARPPARSPWTSRPASRRAPCARTAPRSESPIAKITTSDRELLVHRARQQRARTRRRSAARPGWSGSVSCMSASRMMTLSTRPPR